jgi:hypothetical protein
MISYDITDLLLQSLSMNVYSSFDADTKKTISLDYSFDSKKLGNKTISVIISLSYQINTKEDHKRLVEGYVQYLFYITTELPKRNELKNFKLLLGETLIKAHAPMFFQSINMCLSNTHYPPIPYSFFSSDNREPIESND